MSRQYLRAYSLQVGDAKGNGLELGALQVSFNVRHAEVDVQNMLPSADIRVYNPAPTTAQRLKAKEFTQVILQAGYHDNVGVIFRGDILQARYGRLSPVDTFVDIFAWDGDGAVNYSTVSQTLSSGYTQKDVHGALTTALSADGSVQPGYTADLQQTQAAPRGRCLFGMVKDHLRDFAATNNVVCSISDGKLNTTTVEQVKPGDAVVLNAQTGMIGVPTQEQDAIVVRCLINPSLKPGGKIQINNKDILEAKQPFNYLGTLPTVANDGFYKILAIDYEGDTRGEPWYCTIWALALFEPTFTSGRAVRMDNS